VCVGRSLELTRLYIPSWADYWTTDEFVFLFSYSVCGFPIGLSLLLPSISFAIAKKKRREENELYWMNWNGWRTAMKTTTTAAAASAMGQRRRRSRSSSICRFYSTIRLLLFVLLATNNVAVIVVQADNLGKSLSSVPVPFLLYWINHPPPPPPPTSSQNSTNQKKSPTDWFLFFYFLKSGACVSV